MNASIARRIEQSCVNLIKWSAPTLRDEAHYTPLRPPIFTATLGECLAAKGVTL